MPPEPKFIGNSAEDPLLNSGAVCLLDVPILEQQLFGLVWRGGRIDHQSGEHDDYANSVAGVVRLLSSGRTEAQAAFTRMCLSMGDDEPGEAFPMASAGCPRP